jgi:hypothetical protein
MDLRARQQLNRGYGDAMSRGIEVALVPVVCGGLGWLLDRAVGTEPVFAVLLGTLGIIGTGIKLWIGYDREMAAHEEGAVWNRRPTAPGQRDHDLRGNGPGASTDRKMSA